MNINFLCPHVVSRDQCPTVSCTVCIVIVSNVINVQMSMCSLDYCCTVYKYTIMSTFFLSSFDNPFLYNGTGIICLGTLSIISFI